MADNQAHPCDRRRMLAIDDLSDDDLLIVFDFCVFKYQGLDLLEDRHGDKDCDIEREIERWQPLVHVCRRWRGLVFRSPRRLNLRLYYDPGRSARKTLDAWPSLPLIVRGDVSEFEVSADKAIAVVLEHGDRLCRIDLTLHETAQMEKIWTSMQQVPSPNLVDLCLSHYGCSRYLSDPVALLSHSDSLSGGSISAPRLRSLRLDTIPYPGLPKLFSSATHLVRIHLLDIPHSGHRDISPQVMATSLSTLTSLEDFRLEFKFIHPKYYPDLKSECPSSLIRSVLPTLATFSFRGTIKYLEDFVARIDTPRLSWLGIEFFKHIDFDTPRLNQFICRTPALGEYDRARLTFDEEGARVKLRPSHREPSHPRGLAIKTSDRKLSTVPQVCTLLSRFLSTVENLYIVRASGRNIPLLRPVDDNSEWLDLLLPFKAVKNLYISELCEDRISNVLEELTGERTTEVLPALQNVLFVGTRLQGLREEGIAQFISARQLINRPVSISVWDTDSIYKFVLPLPWYRYRVQIPDA